MITVCIADDHDIVRSGFRMILEHESDIRVLGEAADGNQAYALVNAHRPDVLMLDISMPPGQSGLVACEDIAKDFPETKILVVTMYAESDYLLHTLKSGAKGYLIKNATPAELIEAVRKLASGGTYVHPKMSKALIDQMSGAGQTADLNNLSGRELEVLRLLAQGYTNKEIAEQMFLSIKTVEVYRAKIYAKMGFKRRADLVAFAAKHGLMDI